MHLSTGVRINKNGARYSVCGKYLAYAVQNNLTVISPNCGDLFAEFSCVDVIDEIQWSSDSDHLLCLILSRNSVQIVSLLDASWHCRIQERTDSGLQSACWGPTGHHVITISEFNVKISIWSLIGRSVAYIEGVIMKKNQPLSFSPNGKQLAVVIGDLDRYKISIFSTCSWRIQHEIRATQDVKSPSRLLWSPNNLYIALWDNLDVRFCFLQIYSVKKGNVVGTFEKREKHGMFGVKTACWSPSGQFLIVGCFDECIYVLNYITWTVIARLVHSRVIEEGEGLVYHQVGLDARRSSFELMIERPVTFTAVPGKLGVSEMVFSPDGRFVASKSESMPAIVWVWSIPAFHLHSVCVLRKALSDFCWGSHLTICSESNGVVVWRPTKPSILNLVDFDIDEGVCINNAFYRLKMNQPPQILALSDFFAYVITDSSY